MGDSSRSQPEGTRFVLAPPPPVRSFAISAVAAVTAAAMIALASALRLPQAVAVAGIIIMIFAVVLAAVALVLTVRLRTTLILDTRSITIIKGRHRRAVAWSVIDSVTMQGPRLVLLTKPDDGPDAMLINPQASADATFLALAAEIGRRLDADRGYKRIS